MPLKSLSRTLFTGPCSIFLCRTEGDFSRLKKQLGIQNDLPFLGAQANATTHAFERGNDNVYIVCLGDTKGRTKTQIHSLLVHEAVHIWQWIKLQIGEKEPSVEFEAYAIQNLCQTLFDEVN